MQSGGVCKSNAHRRLYEWVEWNYPAFACWYWPVFPPEESMRGGVPLLKTCLRVHNIDLLVHDRGHIDRCYVIRRYSNDIHHTLRHIEGALRVDPIRAVNDWLGKITLEERERVNMRLKLFDEKMLAVTCLPQPIAEEVAEHLL